MAAVIAILGAGPHGQQLAATFKHHAPVLFDDRLVSYPAILEAVGMDYLVGAAWPWVRRDLVELVPDLHPWMGGNVILPGAQIGHNVEIGSHVHILFNATVAHGCEIGDYTTICAGANLAGDVKVGEGVLIGSGAVIIHGGITIGAGAKIGAGVVIKKDVAPGETVHGSAFGPGTVRLVGEWGPEILNVPMGRIGLKPPPPPPPNSGAHDIDMVPKWLRRLISWRVR